MGVQRPEVDERIGRMFGGVLLYPREITCPYDFDKFGEIDGGHQ